MTRLYWDIVKHAYVVMIWVKHVAKVPIDNIYGDVYRWYKDGGFGNDIETRNALTNSRIEHYPGIHFDEVLDNLKNKLLNMKNTSYEGDLIDLIVDTLKMPFHANILSGGGLRKLRGALLLPNEAAGLQDRIKKAEMACLNCGREFEVEEAVVYSHNGNGTAGLYCMACIPASRVKCTSCLETVPFNFKYSLKKKAPCASHRDNVNEVLKDKDPNGGARPDFASGRLQEGRYRGGVAVAPPPHASPRVSSILNNNEPLFRIRQGQNGPQPAQPSLDEQDAHYERLRAQLREASIFDQAALLGSHQWGRMESAPIRHVDELRPINAPMEGPLEPEELEPRYDFLDEDDELDEPDED